MPHAASTMPITTPEPALLEGQPFPMGSVVRDGGVNFCVFSRHATRMELCVFDSTGTQELHRLALFGPHNGLFHGFLSNAGSGLVYGLRAHGPYEPHLGHRFNPHKLLLDPYAREIVGRYAWLPQHHGYSLGHADGAFSFDTQDNGAQALKARVAACSPQEPVTRIGSAKLNQDRVLYEVHVKGFSKTLEAVPPELRGTYAALAHPASVAHFKALGVTTLSLLPVHYWIDEPALAARGSSNYWGYNSLGFFCPDPRLASQPHDPSAVTAEFRAMVSGLHAAGLEVVLDVVYNHTCEGSEWGPTLSFRGLDNASWYRCVPGDKSRAENFSGCGNTLNVAHPQVTQFVLDSLRYWVLELGVDGFRFDLAPVLGRTDHGFDANAAFFIALQQDPVLSQVHLIAEPWDAGPLGYRVGKFPGRFLEWNDKFRDAVRGYWTLQGTSRGEMARRLTASSDLFHHSQRLPSACVNFITAHDGFTLTDLVSYQRRHNEANGENNADGRDGELCANHGVEGPSDDPAVLLARDRVRRAMLATLLLSQGTPMLCSGDEMGKTQGGNNNAYCQDNATNWLDWSAQDHGLVAFVGRVIALRRREPLLRHAQWFVPESHRTQDSPRLMWLAPAGTEMQSPDWHDYSSHAFACLMERAPGPISTAAPADASRRLMLAMNPGAQPCLFALPPGTWQIALDSSGECADGTVCAGHARAAGRSMLVFRQSLPNDPPQTKTHP